MNIKVSICLLLASLQLSLHAFVVSNETSQRIILSQHVIQIGDTHKSGGWGYPIKLDPDSAFDLNYIKRSGGRIESITVIIRGEYRKYDSLPKTESLVFVETEPGVIEMMNPVTGRNALSFTRLDHFLQRVVVINKTSQKIALCRIYIQFCERGVHVIPLASPIELTKTEPCDLFDVSGEQQKSGTWVSAIGVIINGKERFYRRLAWTERLIFFETENGEIELTAPPVDGIIPYVK